MIEECISVFEVKGKPDSVKILSWAKRRAQIIALYDMEMPPHEIVCVVPLVTLPVVEATIIANKLKISQAEARRLYLDQRRTRIAESFRSGATSEEIMAQEGISEGSLRAIDAANNATDSRRITLSNLR
jgi:hypothetical protein